MTIGTFEKQVRLYIYDHFVKTGQAPLIAQSAQTLSCTVAEVEMAHRRLAEGRALVLQENGEIRRDHEATNSLSLRT